MCPCSSCIKQEHEGMISQAITTNYIMYNHKVDGLAVIAVAAGHDYKVQYSESETGLWSTSSIYHSY